MVSAVFALLLSFSPAHAAVREPSSINYQFCAENADALSSFSPQELCQALDGFPCTTAKNMAQAVCLGTGEGMCSFLKSSDDARYLRHLRGQCKALSDSWIASQAAAQAADEMRRHHEQEQNEGVQSTYQNLNTFSYDRTSIYGETGDE